MHVCTKNNQDTCYPPLKYSLKTKYIQNKNGKKTTIFKKTVVFTRIHPKCIKKMDELENNNK